MGYSFFLKKDKFLLLIKITECLSDKLFRIGPASIPVRAHETYSYGACLALA